jgi:hypothetical protein
VAILICDICGGEAIRFRRPVIRFYLEYRPVGKSGRGKKAGEIALCERCWKNLANPARHEGEVA